MSLDMFLQHCFNALTLGSLYALIAIGYTMVYGIINLINFAQGEVLMVGAYIGFALTSLLGFSFFPALIVSMAACGLLGVIIEKVAYRPLRGDDGNEVLLDHRLQQRDGLGRNTRRAARKACQLERHHVCVDILRLVLASADELYDIAFEIDILLDVIDRIEYRAAPGYTDQHTAC